MADKIKARICFASLICVMVLLLTSCDFHIMSNREVEEQLEKRYGQKFTVLSSASVTDDYFDNDVYRVKLYIVSPKDDPDADAIREYILDEVGKYKERLQQAGA